MTTTYLFDIDAHRVIINDERSGIGYGYPRIFIEKDTETHYNIDTTLGTVFNQKLSEFESWLDGTEINKTLSEFNEVCNDIGINPEALINVVREIINA